MKIINAIQLFLLVGATQVFLIGCSNEEKVVKLTDSLNTPRAVDLNPFPFYKNIEIKQGFNFEVLSWGKGIDTLGGYLLLMSDSVKNNYKSIAVERKGVILDAWNLDLDNDGSPELYVQFVVKKNVNDLNVYEFSNNSFSKLTFPGINSVKGYEGNDQFYVKNGDLFRSVPIVSIDSGKTTTLVKTLKYNLRGNSFSATEVKQ